MLSGEQAVIIAQMNCLSASRAAAGKANGSSAAAAAGANGSVVLNGVVTGDRVSHLNILRCPACA